MAEPQLALLQSLQQDYATTTPDAHVIARQLAHTKKGKQAKLKTTDLAFSITDITPDLTISGAPQIQITMQDPTWRLLDSGFFDTDDDGRLDDMDVNYPDKSRFWWRLHQFSPQADHSIQLTFLPRIVCELMVLKGPVKVNRAKRTRAEFLKSLVAKVDDPQGPIPFFCSQLDKKQDVAGPKTNTKPSSRQHHKDAAKVVGIGANRRDLTSHGVKLTEAQAQKANTILQVGDQLSAPHDALVGAIYAAMGESNLGATAASVFETTGDPSLYSGGTDVAAAAKGFYQGTGSFRSPGGIALANAGAPPWVIANQTEANAIWGDTKWPATSGDSYETQYPGGRAQGIREATAIVAGGGGAGTTGGSTTVEIVQPYYFQVKKREDYWTAMIRLAQEVGWELIVDGNRIYYDPDTALIRQKIAVVLDRDAATTMDWSYDWVNKHIATNFQVELQCGPWEFHPGEVVLAKRFGPASTGSTAKLPGRWLINEIQRNGGDEFSTLTLVQPTAPKPEPAPQVTTKTISSGGGTIGSLSSEQPRTARAVYAAAKYLSSLDLNYTQGMRTLRKSYSHGETALDCSASTWWCMLAAGFPLPGGASWGSWAPTVPTGSPLLPGPGKELTIYASWPHNHVFFHCHPAGLPDMQGNTVSNASGFRFFTWDASFCGGYGGPSPFPDFPKFHYAGV